MAYKIKKKNIEISESYFRKRKEKELFKRTHGHPTKLQILKVAEQNAFGITKREHEVGQPIIINDHFAIVKKVTKKGTYVQEFSGKDELDAKKSYTKFYPEALYEQKAKPFFNDAPIQYLGYNLFAMKK